MCWPHPCADAVSQCTRGACSDSQTQRPRLFNFTTNTKNGGALLCFTAPFPPLPPAGVKLAHRRVNPGSVGPCSLLRPRNQNQARPSEALGSWSRKSGTFRLGEAIMFPSFFLPITHIRQARARAYGSHDVLGNNLLYI